MNDSECEAEFNRGYGEGMDARAAWEVMGAQPLFEGDWTNFRIAGFFTAWEDSRGRWGSPDRRTEHD